MSQKAPVGHLNGLVTIVTSVVIEYSIASTRSAMKFFPKAPVDNPIIGRSVPSRFQAEIVSRTFVLSASVNG